MLIEIIGFVFSIIITMIGIWAKENIVELNGTNPLIYIMKNYIPLPIEMLLCIALIATLVSSADTCLINAATIVENDLLCKKSVKEVRAIVLFIGVITFVLSAIGIKIGSIFGTKYKSKAEFAGGVVLILIGTKILLEHLGIISF